MCEELVKKIYHISKSSGINQVAVITNHLKFLGTLQEGCDYEKNDEILNLTNAKMWRLEDICNCKDPNCKCNEENFCSAEYLHINVSKIVAFTLKK